MNIQIKSRWSDRIIFEGDFKTIRDAVIDAYKQKIVLRGAVLRGADLRGADLRDFPIKIPNIHQRVFEAASVPNALDMGDWHTCETTHCRAGWVVTLAGAAGKTLEWNHGTPTAAALIYIASDSQLEKIPNFYCSNETALADMKRLAELEGKRTQA